MRPRFAIIVLVSTFAYSGTAHAQATKKGAPVVPSAEARSHVNEVVTLEMTVKHAKNNEKLKTYYLDSEEDFSNESNVAVLIPYKSAGAFKNAGIADPSEHFRDKTIRVSGKILKEGNFLRIRVTTPKSIKIVESR